LNLENKTLIGFGIKNKENFEIACKYSSGGIIGSSFIKHLAENGISKVSIKSFVNVFKSEN